MKKHRSGLVERKGKEAVTRSDAARDFLAYLVFEEFYMSTESFAGENHGNWRDTIRRPTRISLFDQASGLRQELESRFAEFAARKGAGASVDELEEHAKRTSALEKQIVEAEATAPNFAILSLFQLARSAVDHFLAAAAALKPRPTAIDVNVFVLQNAISTLRIFLDHQRAVLEAAITASYRLSVQAATEQNENTWIDSTTLLRRHDLEEAPPSRKFRCDGTSAKLRASERAHITKDFVTSVVDAILPAARRGSKGLAEWTKEAASLTAAANLYEGPQGKAILDAIKAKQHRQADVFEELMQTVDERHRPMARRLIAELAANERPAHIAAVWAADSAGVAVPPRTRPRTVWEKVKRYGSARAKKSSRARRSALGLFEAPLPAVDPTKCEMCSHPASLHDTAGCQECADFCEFTRPVHPLRGQP